MLYLITCRSLTSAQRAALFLERKGVKTAVIKAPQGLSSSGCSYALKLGRDFGRAKGLLLNNNMLNGKCFRLENGVYKEMGINDIS